MPDVLCPKAGPGRGLSLGRWEHLKWMTANTGPTDERCSKPRTGSRNGRKRSGIPLSLRRPCLQASKINLRSQAHHSLSSVTASCPSPLHQESPVIPGQQAAGTRHPLPSARLDPDCGPASRASPTPLREPYQGSGSAGRTHQEGEDGFPRYPVVQGTQSTFLFL